MIQDVETERAVIGCVLGGSSAGETGLPGEAFTEWRRHVWDAVLSLEAEKKPVDHLTLAERLQSRGHLAKCGGPAELMRLDSAVPLAHNLAAYVAILRNRMERREVVRLCEVAIREAGDLGTIPEVVAATVAGQLQRVRAPRTLKKGGHLVYELVDTWEKNLEAQRLGGKSIEPTLPWPHSALTDERGIPKGRLTVVAGRSGNFKTGLVSDGIWHWAHTMGIQGGVIGLEDGCSWFLERLTARAIDCLYENVGYARLTKAQEMGLQDWCAKAYDAMESNVFTEDYRSGEGGEQATFPQVFGTIREMVEAGAKWIVIDHGLRINWLPGSGVERYDMAIGHGCQKLAKYAERSGAAIVMLWHLNRSQEEGTFPTRADLAESRYLDAEARKIYVLWKQQQRPGFQLVTTVKATKGKEGYTAALPLSDAQYGLLGREGGYVVNFQEEEAAAKEAREASKAKRKLFP